MIKHTFLPYMVLVSCILLISCTKSASSNNNPYVGTWESTYVYKSGYTNTYFMPVAIKLVKHNMILLEDGTYRQTVTLVYTDDEVSTTFFSGSYSYTDTEIILQATKGIAEGIDIPNERLPEPETYVRFKRTLISKEVYYSESPQLNEHNELKYPIILTFIKA